MMRTGSTQERGTLMSGEGSGLTIRRCSAADLLAIEPILAQHVDAVALVSSGTAWAGEFRGRVVGACGIVPLWENRAHCWAMFGAGIPRSSWTRIVRFMRRQLAASNFRRLEAQVHCGFVPGLRLARMLGFEIEGRAIGFNPDGSDAYFYARVRGHIAAKSASEAVDLAARPSSPRRH